MPLAAKIFYFVHSNEETDQIPVVLIHGAGGTHLYWPPQIRRLPGYQIYALDLPGHGKSPGMGLQSITEYGVQVMVWLDKLGLDKVIFAGHSMGSAIALMIALEYPSRVRGLLLLGAGARLRVHPDFLASSADQANFLTAVKMFTDWGFSPQTPSRLIELASQHMAESHPHVLHDDFMACDGFDVTMRLGEIGCPTLVICGEQDRLTPMRYAQFLVDHIRDARLETIPGGGHMIMLEKPREVKEIMQRFLEQVAGI